MSAITATAISRHLSPVALPVRVTTGALVVVVLVVVTGSAGVASAIAFGCAAVAALVDARSRVVPDGLVLASALAPATLVATGAADGVAVVGGAAVLAMPLFLAHLASPRAMGFGDVKLAAALGAVLGLVDPWSGLVALCLAGALGAMTGLIGRRPDVPFAPALVVGAVLASLAAEPLSSLLTGGGVT